MDVDDFCQVIDSPRPLQDVVAKEVLKVRHFSGLMVGKITQMSLAVGKRDPNHQLKTVVKPMIYRVYPLVIQHSYE